MICYLDNGATTWPKPDIVRKTAHEVAEAVLGNPGRGIHTPAIESANLIFSARESIADLFGGNPEKVVFTPNATYALNMAIKGLCRRGSHVLISNIEHNSVRRPVEALASYGVTYDTYSATGSTSDIINSIKSKIRFNTSMIVACHRSNVSPITLPIHEIGALCRQRGLKFIVDASQSAGAVEIDMEKSKIDILCSAGHKGLFGFMGTGVLVIGKNIEPEDIGTIIEGGSGVDSSLPLMPKVFPERLEPGTLSTHAIATLDAGVRWVKSVGVSEIGMREERLLCEFANMLESFSKVSIYAPKDMHGSSLMFNIKGIEPQDTASLLSDAGICVRSGLHCSPLAHKTLHTPDGGAVRISLSPFNSISDVDCLYKRIQDITK